MVNHELSTISCLSCILLVGGWRGGWGDRLYWIFSRTVEGLHRIFDGHINARIYVIAFIYESLLFRKIKSKSQTGPLPLSLHMRGRKKRAASFVRAPHGACNLAFAEGMRDSLLHTLCPWSMYFRTRLPRCSNTYQRCSNFTRSYSGRWRRSQVLWNARAHCCVFVYLVNTEFEEYYGAACMFSCLQERKTHCKGMWTEFGGANVVQSLLEAKMFFHGTWINVFCSHVFHKRNCTEPCCYAVSYSEIGCLYSPLISQNCAMSTSNPLWGGRWPSESTLSIDNFSFDCWLIKYEPGLILSSFFLKINELAPLTAPYIGINY